MTRRAWVTLATAMAMLALAMACRSDPGEPSAAPRLYWFIPDGLRADPDLFTVFEWAEAGELPNIRRMMREGAWGYSRPVFPSHTPTNFATLLTGAYPVVHGVADGPMHTEGSPLSGPSVGGFSSVAKKVPPVWKVLESAGFKVALLSVPGSTPPELEHGLTVRGRWGGWGADTPALVVEPLDLLARRREAGKAFRLFFFGQRLTEFVALAPATGWSDIPTADAPLRHAALTAYGLTLHVLVSDSTADGLLGYDTVTLAQDGATPMWTLHPNELSSWAPVSLVWKGQTFPSHLRARVIKLWPETGQFRLRLYFDNANRFNTVPAEAAAAITEAAGPMVDFVDNWPQQLVHEEEDRQAFLDEALDSLEWHRRAVGTILDRQRPDVLIQDTYTPNQMLESRWWLRDVDGPREPSRESPAWHELMALYRGIDAILGEALKRADDTTVIVLSSDHGIIPLRRQVRLNNLFARRGWLSFSIDDVTGEPTIDWDRTQVVYLKMAHVYVKPEGLGGDWQRGHGDAYEELRNDVIEAIEGLTDEDGARPLVRAVRWEDAPGELRLPTDRVGDLVLESRPGFMWWEEVTPDLALFTTPLGSGYKQAVDATSNPGLWTPFVVMGPGVRHGVSLSQPISHVDQLPTLLRLLGVEIPPHVQGRVLEEILE